MKTISALICFMFLLSSSLSFVNYKSVTASAQSPGDNLNETIIIDPGHGGFDSGASTTDGTREKDLNLEFSKKLNDILILNGFNTFMTRTDDSSTARKNASHKKKSDIYERFSISKKYPNAVFISIHQNYFKEESSKGTQVFYGSKNINSRYLAEILQNNVASKLQKDNRRQIKESDRSIFLLKNIENPCILIECGFMTNRKELESLKSPDYQQKLMALVCDSLERYFKERPVG